MSTLTELAIPKHYGPARDAAPPFDDSSRADVVLRSSDDMHFRVSKTILAIASPIFADMFSLSPPLKAEAVDETYHGLPVVPMAEDAATLDLLLRWCYPVRPPKLTTLEDVRRLAEVSRKYLIDAFVDAIDDALRACLVNDPVGVFAVAFTYKLDEIARTAARAALRVPLPEVVSSPFSKLSSNALNTLIQYHLACGVAAAAVTSRRDFFKDERGFTTKYSSPCDLCAFRDESGTRCWYAPRYVWKYLDNARRILCLHPHEEAISIQRTINTCCFCSDGDVQRMKSARQFEERFIGEVNAVIDKVRQFP
ncbi:hypothetical protein FA95DRAFT_1494157 [Auriscalpium vulgare]|uniref:Uncharacterized protein n=1 Tax=Auriscalpium vulgare TaxID=40419 RepID=A0ACB8RRE2_9AGAM|nr:hypothetical protein FA95DRAFT_1494157 [Auriscalpium vulgare]